MSITTDPKVMAGKPVIAGTRITVELILDLLASGETAKTIVEQYPHLKSEDVPDALAFAEKQQA